MHSDGGGVGGSQSEDGLPLFAGDLGPWAAAEAAAVLAAVSTTDGQAE